METGMKKISPPKNFKTKYEKDDYSPLDHIFEIKKYIKDNHSTFLPWEEDMARQFEELLFNWHKSSDAFYYLYNPEFWKEDAFYDHTYTSPVRRKPEIDLYIGWHGYGRFSKIQIRWFPHTDMGAMDYDNNTTDFKHWIYNYKGIGPIVDLKSLPIQDYIRKNNWLFAAHYADLIKLVYRNIETQLSYSFKVYRLTDSEKIFNGEDLIDWNFYDVGERFLEEFEVNYDLTPDDFINHMLEKGELINTQRASRKFKKLGYKHLTPMTVENIIGELCHYREGRSKLYHLKWRNLDGDKWPIFKSD